MLILFDVSTGVRVVPGDNMKYYPNAVDATKTDIVYSMGSGTETMVAPVRANLIDNFLSSDEYGYKLAKF